MYIVNIYSPIAKCFAMHTVVEAYRSPESGSSAQSDSSSSDAHRDFMIQYDHPGRQDDSISSPRITPGLWKE